MNKLNSRTIILISTLVITVATLTLLYYERIETLYILATLGLVGILLSVAFSDLEGVERNSEEIK